MPVEILDLVTRPIAVRVPFSINTGCAFLSARPSGVVQAGGNDLPISVLLGTKVLRKPALVADEDSSVIVVPISDGVTACPSGIGRCVGPFWIGRTGAKCGEKVEDVTGGHATVKIGVRWIGDDALFVDRVPDCALTAGSQGEGVVGDTQLKAGVPDCPRSTRRL